MICRSRTCSWIWIVCVMNLLPCVTVAHLFTKLLVISEMSIAYHMIYYLPILNKLHWHENLLPRNRYHLNLSIEIQIFNVMPVLLGILVLRLLHREVAIPPRWHTCHIQHHTHACTRNHAWVWHRLRHLYIAYPGPPKTTKSTSPGWAAVAVMIGWNT